MIADAWRTLYNYNSSYTSSCLFTYTLINVLPTVHTCSFKPKCVAMNETCYRRWQSIFDNMPCLWQFLIILRLLFSLSLTDGTKEAFLYNLLDYGRLLLITCVAIIRVLMCCWPCILAMINFRFQLMHYNFISLIILLHMFRAPMCPSSGGSTIHSQQLVQCHLFCRPYSR